MKHIDASDKVVKKSCSITISFPSTSVYAAPTSPHTRTIFMYESGVSFDPKHISYLELYNEKVCDLLDPTKEKDDLPIRQDKDKIFIPDLTEVCGFACTRNSYTSTLLSVLIYRYQYTPRRSSRVHMIVDAVIGQQGSQN